MNRPPKTVYSFGDFRLDPSNRQLFHNNEPVPLTPKVLDALLLLVENAGQLVEKEEFMRRLWPDAFVGDDALAQNISLLRKALGDKSVAADWIVTVPKRGYRLATEVKAESGQGTPVTSIPGASEASPVAVEIAFIRSSGPGVVDDVYVVSASGGGPKG